MYAIVTHAEEYYLREMDIFDVIFLVVGKTTGNMMWWCWLYRIAWLDLSLYRHTCRSDVCWQMRKGRGESCATHWLCNQIMRGTGKVKVCVHFVSLMKDGEERFHHSFSSSLPLTSACVLISCWVHTQEILTANMMMRIRNEIYLFLLLLFFFLLYMHV